MIDAEILMLIRKMDAMASRINQLDRRQNNFAREAVVTQIFPEEGTAVVDAGGVKSKKIPWLQRSGSIREWDPPAVGERVILLSPTGEPGQGMILPGGYTDEFPAPHNQAAEKVTTIGDVSVKQSGSALEISAGGVTVTISDDGLAITGGSVTHNSKNIGDTHVHGGIVPGASDTSTPH